MTEVASQATPDLSVVSSTTTRLDPSFPQPKEQGLIVSAIQNELSSLEHPVFRPVQAVPCQQKTASPQTAGIRCNGKNTAAMAHIAYAELVASSDQVSVSIPDAPRRLHAVDCTP